MSVRWTEEQKQIIDNRGTNLLVSAAAGSGKTAVLVEHIIQRILDKENPVDIDKLMVVTFTNAAAGEMRERIMSAIENALENDSENTHLQKQLAYIHNAKITTLHSFCLNLVREHFNAIDIDPGFRIGDTGEIELLKSDLIADVLEQYYQMDRDDFYEFVEQVSPNGKDKYIEEVVLKFYNQAMSCANPKKWIMDSVSSYDVDSEKIKSSLFMMIISENIDMLLNECLGLYEQAISVIDRPDGPKSYYDTLSDEKIKIQQAVEAKTYNEKCDIICNMEFKTVRCKKGESTEELREEVKELRNAAKKMIKTIVSEYCGMLDDENIQMISKMKNTANVLADVTISFMEAFQNVKKEKNIVDFNDFEHFALQILTKTDDDGNMIPSKVADEIAGSIEEVIVDEYQDINEVQDTILKCLSTERFGRPDMFMVGDVKQSIYGFRMADPGLFIKKYNQYSFNDKKDRKIILKKNFRSRKEILDSVNFIFRRIMYGEFGKIDYDDENALYLGANYPEVPAGQNQNTELLIANVPTDVENDTDDEESFVGLSKKQAEGKMIASRIKQLTDNKNGFQVYDTKEGKYRTAKYSDILILLRSTKGNADIILDELTVAGIPAYYDRQTGYFDAMEVNEIICLLNIIDNPHQDIPLTATLKSVFCGLSNNDLAMVRAQAAEKTDMYDAVLDYIENADTDLADKLQLFVEKLDAYRNKTSYMSIYDLITFIIEDTGYDNYVAALPAGEKRSANIEMLKEKAIEYENGSYKGLFNFVRYIEKIKKYEIEAGEASVTTENENAVSIMSIHKSKGLEYPIVFIANMNGKFNTMDSNKNVLIHKELGVGMDYIHEDTRIRDNGMYKRIIKLAQGLDLRYEELRILYVAMTRAKEKLIMTANKLTEKKAKDYAMERYVNREHVSKAKLSGAWSMLDFVGNALGCSKCMENIIQEYIDYREPVNDLYNIQNHIETRFVDVENMMKEHVKERVLDDMRESTLRKWDNEYVYSKEIREEISKRLSYVYPFSGAVNNYAKVSVSDLKHKKMEELEDAHKLVVSEKRETVVPQFVMDEDGMEKQFLKGAARGTAYHRVFELYDFNVEVSADGISDMISKMHNENKIDDISYQSVNAKDVLKFAESNLAMRMKKAYENGSLYREAQFVMGVNGNAVYSDTPDDMVLVQGIVDVYFVEDGEIVIADYKTDKVKTMSELDMRYREQLLQYRNALEQITNMKVKEMIIYSVTLSEEYSIIPDNED